jgi:uncharacterized protein (DUF433 family)
MSHERGDESDGRKQPFHESLLPGYRGFRVPPGGARGSKMRIEVARMSEWQPAAYKEYQWIVADPRLLGGKLAVRGTRLSVSLILECLAGGMSLEDIDEAFDRAFPHEALPEVLKVASELTNSFHVAA